MAQRVHPLGLRLGYNLFWDSVWYSNKNFAHLLHENFELKRFFINIFKHGQILTNRVVLKRVLNNLFLNVYIYANIFPRKYRWRTRRPKSSYTEATKKNIRLLSNKRKIKNISAFVASFSGVDNVFISIINLFIFNMKRKRFVNIRATLLNNFKRFKFFKNILYIFNIVVRVRASNLLVQSIRIEIERLEGKKKNRKIWRLMNFLRRLVKISQTGSVLGIRIYVKGRFNGRKRSRQIRIGGGSVPYNTLRAKLDYAFSKAVTINGSYGIKAWVCYSLL